MRTFHKALRNPTGVFSAFVAKIPSICVKTAGPAQWPIILTKTKGTTDLVTRTLAPHEPNVNRSAEQ